MRRVFVSGSPRPIPAEPPAAAAAAAEVGVVPLARLLGVGDDWRGWDVARAVRATEGCLDTGADDVDRVGLLSAPNTSANGSLSSGLDGVITMSVGGIGNCAGSTPPRGATASGGGSDTERGGRASSWRGIDGRGLFIGEPPWSFAGKSIRSTSPSRSAARVVCLRETLVAGARLARVGEEVSGMGVERSLAVREKMRADNFGFCRGRRV